MLVTKTSLCSALAAVVFIAQAKAADEVLQASANSASSTCAFMQPRDWNLINGNDSGKLIKQKDGSWNAKDSNGVMKWYVAPLPSGDAYLKADKDLRGVDNVISIILGDGKNGGGLTPFNFYISAGQMCRNEQTSGYMAAIKAGHKIVDVYHYQRFKVLPKAKKGGPHP